MAALAAAPVSLRRRRRFHATPRVVVDPQTEALTIRFPRPVDPGTTIRVQLVLLVDDEVYRCIGQVTGQPHDLLAAHGVPEEYCLAYSPPTVMRQGRFLRIGETAQRRLEAFASLELLRGRADLEVLLDRSVTPAAQYPVHNSVAFDAATSSQEQSGDGVLSLTHTSTGSNRAVFGTTGAQDVGGGLTSTSMTYGGTAMTEMWDLPRAGANIFAAAYRLHAQSTGAQTVTSTITTSLMIRQGLGVVSFTGVDQTTPVGTPQTTTGTATPATVTVASVGTDDMVVDSLLALSNSGTVGADQTARIGQDLTSSYTLRISTQPGSTGGVMSWTFDAVDFFVYGAVAFKATAAGTAFSMPATGSSYGLTGVDMTGVVQQIQTWLRVGR